MWMQQHNDGQEVTAPLRKSTQNETSALIIFLSIKFSSILAAVLKM